MAGGRCGRLGRRPQAGLAEIGGVRETGGVALHHTDSGTAVAATGDLLGAAVIEAHRGGALVLREHLGEVGACAHRRREHSFQHVLVDHVGEPTDTRRE